MHLTKHWTVAHSPPVPLPPCIYSFSRALPVSSRHHMQASGACLFQWSAISWWCRLYGYELTTQLALLVHTNTGCEYEDHSKWALWACSQAGQKWQVFPTRTGTCSARLTHPPTPLPFRTRSSTSGWAKQSTAVSRIALPRMHLPAVNLFCTGAARVKQAICQLQCAPVSISPLLLP